MDNLKIAFVHPDLGIGGAERLVVDAAVGVQGLGHKVTMYTSHHDPSHCFEETRDGTLTVRVGGNSIVPRTFMGRFYIICAILRNILLSLGILFGSQKYDVIFVDQLSVSIPLLRLTGARILFYCHFPDKMLTKRDSVLKKIYRLPVDLIEEFTTGMADSIVVNSKFTGTVFKDSFKMLPQVPDVLYPSIQFDKFDRQVDENSAEISVLKSTRVTFVSINRYERKKDIGLAIRAFARLVQTSRIAGTALPRLVIAGGYDTRVEENVNHHLELVALANEQRLTTHTVPAGNNDNAPPTGTQVLFLQSISDAQKVYLIRTAKALLYTPTNEHFGIVPVEAMYLKCPVIAANSGGPTESILHGRTGYLCPPQEAVWSETMRELFEMSQTDLDTIGQAGHDRVLELFSLAAFVAKLETIMSDLIRRKDGMMTAQLVSFVSFIVPALAIIAAFFVLVSSPPSK